MLMTSIVEVILFPPPLEFKDSTLLTSSYLRTALVVLLFGLIYGEVGRLKISSIKPMEVYLALLRWLRHLPYWPKEVYLALLRWLQDLLNRPEEAFFVLLRWLRDLLYWPELIYCILQPQSSLTVLPYLVLFLIFQRYWVHYWYPKAQEQEQFLKLVTFTLYFLTSEIYWQRNVMGLGLVSAGILFLSLAAMWLTQLVIFKYFKDEAVLVGSDNSSSADSGHMLVKVGEVILEIGKRRGLFTAIIKRYERERDEKPHFKTWQYFCIPTLTYGIMGRRRRSKDQLLQQYEQELLELFNVIIARQLGEVYNFSYQSCQETALNYVAEITKPEEPIPISLTISKNLLLAVSVCLPGLLLVAWSRLSVIVQWRHD
uniref:Uncharacterized protein n=1 Tax=Plectus sambesii TaxID=2011161 RepID=A0A914V6L3_9BILA